jgi:glutathione peroxidase
MIVNTASQCGYTPQLTPLEELYKTYGAQGFSVLGFPSDSFNQEYDTGSEVSTFCTTQYKITFPMFAIGDVIAPSPQPVFAWIYAQPGYETPIAWNFEKFLISKQGKVVKRFLTAVSPDAADVKAAIEAELAK